MLITIEELEIVVRAKVEDAMNGIKKLTNEVKKATGRCVEPMKQLSEQSKVIGKQLNESTNKINFSNISKSLEKEKDKVKKITDEIKINTNEGFSFTYDKNKNGDFATKYEEARKKYMDTISNNNDGVPRDVFGNVTKSLEEVKREAEEVEEKLKSVKALKNINSDNNKFRSIGNVFSFARQKIEDYKNSLNRTAKEQEYLKSKINDMKYTLKEADAGRLEGVDVLKLDADIERTENRLKQLKSQSKSTKKHLADCFVNAKNKAKQFASSIGKGLINGFKRLSSAVKSSGSNINKSLNDGIKSLKKFAFSLIGLRTIWLGVTKAVNSYLSYDTALQDSINNCWSALGSLLAPILEYVVGLFYKLVSYVVAFVQALTGVNLVARANSKAINGQAGATKKLNKATQEANSSLDEFHTISKDTGDSGDGGGGSDLKPITVDPIDISLDDILDKIFNYDWYKVGFEIGKKINEALSKINWDFIQKLAVALGTDLGNLLNGLVDGLDWELIGKTLAEGFDTAFYFLNAFFKTFNWDNLGKALGTGINGFVKNFDWTNLGELIGRYISAPFQVLENIFDTIDWSKLGKSLATGFENIFKFTDFDAIFMTFVNAFNGVFTMIADFFENVDFGNIAKKIVTSLNNAISKIDFKVVGRAIQNIINSAIDFAFELVSNFDGIGLGTKLAELMNSLSNAIKNIDWKKLGQTISDLLHKAFESAITLLKETDWGALFKNIIDAIVDFIIGIDWLQLAKDLGEFQLEIGKALVEGLWAGIKAAVVGVGKILWEILIKPIIDAVKEKFGIHSPSTVFADLGKALIEGLWSGIESLKNWIKDKWENVKGWFSDIVKSASVKISQKWNDIKGKWHNIVDNIKDKTASMKAKVATTWGNLKNKWHNLMKNFKDKTISIKAKIGGVVGSIKSTINNSVIKPINRKLPKVFPKIPYLAKGGVLFDDTIVRVGEYQGARSNPEIVSPRNMMREVFLEALNESNANRQPQEVNVNVTGETKLKGNDLVITYDKAKKSKGYNGGKNPSFLY